MVADQPLSCRGRPRSPLSERVIVGGDDAKPCAELPPSADCLPSSLDVDGADFVFASDGTLFVSTGFGGGEEHVEHSAFLAQDRVTLGGKILHVDREGRGLPSNPFWDGDPRATGRKSGRRASGTRSAWRCSLGRPRPSQSAMSAGTRSSRSSGSDAAATPDGRALRAATYARIPRHTALRRLLPRPPGSAECALVGLPHPPGIAIIGGVPLTRASGLPADLRHDYAFADWGAGTLTLVPLEETSNPKQIPLARSAAGPVRLRVGPDGALYYLAANSGDLRRIAAR